MRSLLRRAFHSLPPYWCLHINCSLPGRSDWLDRIKLLRLKEQRQLESIALSNSSSPDRKRIVIYTFERRYYADLEYTLATALRLRGHEVRGVLCNGLLPICEMNNGPQERPTCESCSGWTARYADAYGFKYAWLRDYLTQDDLHAAQLLVSRAPDCELPALVVNGVRVGHLARNQLPRYYRGFVFELSGQVLAAYRQWLVSAVLLTWLSERLLDSIEPHIVLTGSGKTLPTACIFQAARLRGIRVVTWDSTPWYPNGLLFNHNSPAVDVHLDDLWAEVSGQKLTDSQVYELNEFLRRWSRSEITPFPYNLTPIEDEQAIRHQLGLRPRSSIVVAFTNTSWDMAVVDRDVGFESMYDWIFALVEYAIGHPEVDLVVRAHPAEKKVPACLQSRTLVATEIRKRYTPLPSNIKIIEGDSPISSYTLGKMAQVAMIYTTRLGLELALRGKRPWVAGNVPYRGKGFTLDLASPDHMVRLLDSNSFDDILPEEEVELARRFAYLWIFRHVVRMPFVDPETTQFSFRSLLDLAPGGNPIIEDLCEAILTGKPFINVGACQDRSCL